MIDHETARRSIATSLDFPLDPDERAALDDHLDDCAACRSFAVALRGDAATLGELDFGPVPVEVRANVAIAAERRGRGAIGRWVAIVAVGALLLVAIGGGALSAGSRGGDRGGVGGDGAGNGTPAPMAAQIAWQTDVVGLAAREFSITANGLMFRADVPSVDVRSDPGDSKERTLEVTWQEHGVEMRLSMYFRSDATIWWVDDLRIYNGKAPGEWLYAKGPLFRTPLGGTWAGDMDIPMADLKGVGGTPARVHFAGLALATRPADLVAAPANGGVRLLPNSEPFAVGQPLHCAGILQLEPAQAQAALLKLGYRVSWRHIINDGTYVELLRDPPPGTIIVDEPPLVGTEGQILMPIAVPGMRGTGPAAVPDDCPRFDPNLTPPPPVPAAS